MFFGSDKAVLVVCAESVAGGLEGDSTSISSLPFRAAFGSIIGICIGNMAVTGDGLGLQEFRLSICNHSRSGCDFTKRQASPPSSPVITLTHDLPQAGTHWRTVLESEVRIFLREVVALADHLEFHFSGEQGRVNA